MALADQPRRRERQRHRAKAGPWRRAQVARRLLERGIDRGECRRGDPHREHEPVRRVDQHDAGNGSVQSDLVEDAGDVHVDGQVRHRLRQQEREQDRAAPRQPEARERVTRRDRHRQREHDRQRRDPDARPEREERVAAGLEHAIPERETELLRQFVREIPLLRECPEQQVRERPEDQEGEQREQRRAHERLGPPPHRERVHDAGAFPVACRR